MGAATRRWIHMAGAVLLVAAGMGVVSAIPAAALTSGTRSNEPWVVEVYGSRFGVQGGRPCTGAAIAEEWVLTADHCEATDVFYRYTPSGGEEVRAEVAVAEAISLAPLDMKLLRLSERRELPRFPKLRPGGYRVGSVGDVYGVGEGLLALQRSEKVWIRNVGPMAHGAIGMYTTATTGGAEQIAQPGDSGGPLMVGGNLVGVFYGSTELDEPVQKMGFTDVGPVVAKLRELQAHGRFPREASPERAPEIADVAVARGHVEVTLSDALVHSGRRVVVWVNWRYAGELDDGRFFYSWKRDVPGGAVMVPTADVRDGDLIQVGELASGVDVAAADLLFQSTLNGVDSVRRSGDRVAVRMSEALVRSGKRVVIWVDGVYRAEVIDDVSYYASKSNDAHGSLITPDGTVTDGALVTIGVLPSGTDLDRAEILDARTL